MSDDTEDASPKIRRATVQVNLSDRADLEQALVEQEKALTPSERAMRDLKLGIGPRWDGVGLSGLQGLKHAVDLSDTLAKMAMPKGFSNELAAIVNAATVPAIKGINASVVASMAPSIKAMNTSAVASMMPAIRASLEPSFARMNATAFAGLNASIEASLAPTFARMGPGISAPALAGITSRMGPGFNTGPLASDYLRFVTASLPKFRTDQFLSPGTFGAFKAAQLSAVKFDFAAMTDRPAGVLGRLDTALHADLGLGVAVDSLIAAPKRNGPVGFDYGAVQRRTREVGDLLSENPPSTDLVEVVEEAQEVTGLDDDVMDGLSVFLGVPPPQGYAGGAIAARILFIGTLGTCVVVNDTVAGQVLTLGAVLNAMVLGREMLTWLREGRKPE